jgi:hypothetical protein
MKHLIAPFPAMLCYTISQPFFHTFHTEEVDEAPMLF